MMTVVILVPLDTVTDTDVVVPLHRHVVNAAVVKIKTDNDFIMTESSIAFIIYM